MFYFNSPACYFFYSYSFRLQKVKQELHSKNDPCKLEKIIFWYKKQSFHQGNSAALISEVHGQFVLWVGSYHKSRVDRFVVQFNITPLGVGVVSSSID